MKKAISLYQAACDAFDVVHRGVQLGRPEAEIIADGIAALDHATAANLRSSRNARRRARAALRREQAALRRDHDRLAIALGEWPPKSGAK